MAVGTLKLSGALKIGNLASAPVNPENGFIYYDTTLGQYRQWNGSSFIESADLEQLLSTANGEGASLIGIEDAAAQFTAINVEGALTESIDAAQAAQSSADANASSIAGHLDGGANKHDASEVDYERLDGSKKNIQAASDDLEASISDLDDAIGALDATPTNYSATDAAIVADHLAGIDAALVSAGGTEFDDATFKIIDSAGDSLGATFDVSAVTGADKSITMPDSNVDLGDIITPTERSKLSGIEALADVTDTANVNAAGAVMESDTSTASMGFVIDEDDMVSDSATQVPTQQSVKAFVDNSIASQVTYRGGYNATTNSPDLDTSPIATSVGDMYTVTAAGVFFATNVEIGDVLIAEVLNATIESEWTIVNKNLDAASIKTSYESNSDTNAFTDAEQTKVANLSGTNTGDEVAASTTVAGIIELATVTETDTGSATNRAVTPAGLANIQSDVDANTAKVGYTAGQAQTDVVNDSISDGNTVTAPSENAVFDALALKLSNVVEDTTPELGGDLTLGSNVVIHDVDGMKRGTSNSAFLEEEYIHSIALLGSQTNTIISALTFAHASFEGLEMTYKLKEAVTGNIRIGTLRIVTNGTDISFSDVSVDTASTGIEFDAIVNGLNVEIRYSSGTNGGTIRADVKRILA